MAKTTYNERSWAIDLIVEINHYAVRYTRSIKRAGGESTIKAGKTSLFPDVLLFGNASDILMGWELKMPDTPITDTNFINNAALKAEILGLTGFLLWNVTEAVLYLLVDGAFKPARSWDILKSKISTRNEVEKNRSEWVAALHIILKDLNDLFDSGTIKKKTFVESFKDSTIIEVILRNSETVAVNLQIAERKDAKFSAEVEMWWRVTKHEYPRHEKWDILSQIILVNWINKILFAHILIVFFSAAKAVETINHTTTPEHASDIFNAISKSCDFWNIFQSQLGETYLTTDAWSEIVQLNILLNNIELSSIGHELLQDLLESVVYASKRKVAGQYSTPMLLARLLVSLTMQNRELILHDPCCGTGTIPKAAYDIKKEVGITAQSALEQILASDKVAFPLQMATLAISEPINMGEIVQIFKEDCTLINVGNIINLHDPYTGALIEKKYDGVDYVTSNLPFIQQEDLKILNPNIKENTNRMIQELTGENIKLSAKSDLYAYLPFYIWNFLNENGRLGIIISNSWLATEWGEIFRGALHKFYHFEYVITAARGRWFQNADVVTNIVILNKRTLPNTIESNEITKFVSIYKTLPEIATNENIHELYTHILTNTSHKYLAIHEYKTADITTMSLNWNALFADITWIKKIEDKLISTDTFFEINRGERRGWNPMFYPEPTHGIEDNYIRPVLKSSRHIQTLVASPQTEAFCCSESIEALNDYGHSGALNWIDKFVHAQNTDGEPLTESLAKVGYYWYEMNDSTMADLVASINFNHRIFIAKMAIRSFVDQRLTRFTARDETVDIDLSHALLNSIVGIFFIESLGFGRGLGVLDLSSTRMKKLPMLNPTLLTPIQKTEILRKFLPIRDRDILPIKEELQQADRQEFDRVVLESFGIFAYKDQILNSFMTSYEMRISINEE